MISWPVARAVRTPAVAAFTAIVALTLFVLRRLLWLHAENSAYQGFEADVGALFAATALLLLLALVRCAPRWQGMRSASIGAMLGVIFFIATFGLGIADPTNIGWVLREDTAQHFIGWQFYRQAPWQWPPGAFDNFWYPVGTAVLYTDSLPLLAMPLKLVSTLLPARFQYIGAWLLVNCAFQGAAGALLVRCFNKDAAVQAIGAGFFLLAPVFLSRYNHDTLTTQWLILAALCIYFRPSQPSVGAWLGLGGVAALVHPYLSAMVLAVAFAFYLRRSVAEQLESRRSALINFAAVIGITLLGWWICGAFTVRPSGGGISLGVYNANMLAWFDPQFMSRWLPTLPASGPGQYEGRGYLGLGVLALVCVGLFLGFRRKRNAVLSERALWPLLLVCAVATFYAWGTRYTFGKVQLIDLTPKQTGILESFRASGRFIWLSVYLITLVAIVVVAQRTGRWAILFLGFAVVLQLVDLAPLHARTAHLRQGIDAHPLVPTLHDPWWDEASAGKRHITLVPPPACGKAPAPYFPFSLLATDHNLTINTGYLARFDEGRTFAYCDVLKQQLESGNRDPDTLYIVSSELLDHFRATSAVQVDCRVVETYNACVTK